ncbi:serine/threonine-protein kinase 36 [Sinocyclocheilus anshuiensis]|uniref:serine/threonine-protein kinase 36 n=1 Tax=Sinocyclocheilus anshuiensis TaxID=1608454 RepID=UPI0007B83541|nr:PREDICTED: serine/threonine-protein kinase 36 [Sinocyclocheilus anshuiensis]
MMDQYHILEVIGEGSFGRVYKGRRKFSGQVVALKFIPKVGRSEKDLRSLKREIDIMRGLKHPNIVLLLDSFETEREVVVVTEYAEGELFQILEDDGSLPENQVSEIACQLVSALYYLHSHRILHRDMKPQNILLGKGGVVKLCDFGFARAMSVSTLVLTSIKGTPLYMSPELVEEKPYDHSADLWSLGCILYELHTGAPPFYTNSIFRLVQLIVRDPVKWPDNMSQDCLSFLKGLLMKDPEKRLSWPDLLHHPFVADGVLTVSDEGSSNPLTVPPSLDLQALKHQQAAEKTTARGGEGKLLCKARELREKEKIYRQEIGSGSAVRASKTASAGGAPTTGHSLGSTFSVDQNSSQPATNQHQANDNSVTRVRSAPHKGQISRDYEREFPSVEVGPREVLKRPGHARTSLASVRMDSEEQDIDSDYEWQRLIEINEQGPVNTSILQKLKTRLLVTKNQLLVSKGEEAPSVLQPLKILRNIVQSCQCGDVETLGKELELPHLLFNLTEDILNIPDLMQDSQGEIVLGDLMNVLIMYLEKSPGWEIKGRRAEDLCQLFISVFLCRDPKRSALLATAVLTLFTRRGISVNVSMEGLTAFLGNILTDTAEAHNPLPAGWGMCDGLLSLILHRLSECDSSSLLDFQNSELWPCLWAKVNTTLETATPQSCLFSPNGLYVFLSLALLVFSSDSYNCVALLSDNSTNCSSALSHFLTTSCAALLERGIFWGDSEISSLSVMSCQLLCIPFSLELPLEKLLSVLRSYQSSNIVAGLVQMIQTLPVALVELPLCLLNRLLLSDPQHTAPCLITAAQATSFLPYSTECSDNRADHTQNQFNHFGNGVEQFKSNGIAKKNKIDHNKGDIKSKKRLEQLKGNVDASKEKNYSIKTQYQSSRNKNEKIRDLAKTKIYPQKTMDHLRDKIEQQSSCIEELMDSLEIHGSSVGRLQYLSSQQGCNISWLIDSLEELRSCDHPKVSKAKIRSSPEEVRTAGSLLAVLLQSELLSGCAVELLILLSHLTRHLTHHSSFFLPVETTQLQFALRHRDDGIRAACCGLLGNLGSGVRQVIGKSNFDLFQDLLGCLCDLAPSVRRAACKAVGNWLSVMRKTDLTISNKVFKNTTGINALSVQDKLKRTPAMEGIRHSERDVWMELAMGAARPLVSLLSDADNVIRQHCCGALGNLAAFGGGNGALLNADAPGLILQTACNDSHHAVRRAAVATLRVFSQQNTLLQALRSLDAGRKLCRTSQSSLFQRDYQWLVSKLDGRKNIKHQPHKFDRN